MPSVQTTTSHSFELVDDPMVTPHADILRYIVKNHKIVTSAQWKHIRTILEMKDQLFPEDAYIDNPVFDENEHNSLQLSFQASVAHDFFSCLLGVIERQMDLSRPNWARWMVDWLAHLGK